MLFRPTGSKGLAEGVWAVLSGIGNFYILDAGGALIAFDSGMSRLFSGAGMRKLGLDPARVSHVFLTHSDFDHIGGLSLFPGAKIYLSRREEPMVTGRKGRLLFIRNRRIKGYTPLDDGQEVSIGRRTVRLIPAPGHTPGSACYLVDGKILVAGDALRTAPDGRIIPFLFLQNMNHAENRRTLERLRGDGVLAGARWILTGHTGALEQGRP